MNGRTRAPSCRRAGAVAAWMCLAAGALAAGSAAAQQATLAVSRGPYYVGDAIDVKITAVDFQEQPVPTVDLAAPPGARLQFAGVQPSVSTSIVVANGQVRRTKDVSFVFDYVLFLDRPGTVTLGPARVVQAGATAATQALRVAAKPVPSDDRVSVELELQQEPVYVGERVPVTLHFELRGTLRENLHRYVLRVPFFDMTDTFQFLEAPTQGTTDVRVTTAAGELDLKGSVSEAKIGGEDVLRVSVERIAVPLRAGSLDVPSTTLDVEEGVRFRRDLFGGRTATQIRKWRAADLARTLEVKTVPASQTPPSYAGAVGSGFTLAVAADHTVVQVGEPITLTFELRGDGNLATASLPQLDAPGLLPANRFRVPDGELTGIVDGTVKRFTATVRVLDPTIEEIPALEYAWFDPQTQEFQTTHSRPVALSVRAGQVVGAEQVESTSQPTDEAPPADASIAEATRQQRGPLVLTGADLAIERDAARLLRAPAAAGGGGWAVFGVYAGTLLLVAWAGLDRRRREVDPVIQARRRRVRELLGRVEAAKSLSADAAAAELASALRELRAALPDARSPELEALLGECDARIYAPVAQRDDSPVDPAFHARAVAAAQQLVREAP